MFTLLIFLFIVWFFFTQIKNNNIKRTPIEPNKTRNPRFLNLSIILAVIGFNLFLYGTASTSRIPLLGLGFFNLFSIATVIISMNKNKYSLLTWATAGLSVLSGLSLMLRANGFVQSVNITTMWFSLILLLFIHIYDDVAWKGLWILKNFLKLIPHTFRQVLALLKRPKTEVKSKKLNILNAFKTIAITAVILIFFTSLLSSADPVFSKIIEKFRDEALGRTFASLFVAGIALLFLTQKTHKNKEDTWRLGFFSFSDLFIPTLSLVTLFGVFLAVQANYLFGSDINLETFNLTYSEYVRKGFIELLTTAFFGGILSYLVVMKSRLTEIAKYKIQLKIVNVALLIELFLMLGSALKRDLMYVEAYGLTRVRIIGGLFLFWLAGLLALLLIMSLYKSFKEKRLLAGIALLSVFVVATLNIANIDQMVVDGSPEHHDYKDYFYINNLSEDGYKGWAESIEAIKIRTEVLLTKDSLTDTEKSQLAGDKLSLISLQEKRVDVIKKYAPEKWLLDNWCEEIDCIYRSENGKRTYRHNSLRYEDKQIDKEKLTKELPKRLDNSRSWKHYNWSEYRAYQHITNNKEIFFEQVDKALDAIRFYQIEKGIDLQKQEKWFTSEFTYPFINIDLDYYPEELSSYTKPSKLGEKFSEHQIKLMNENKEKVTDAGEKGCDLPPQTEFKFVAMMKLSNKVYINTDQPIKPMKQFEIWDQFSKNNAMYGLLFSVNYTDGIYKINKESLAKINKSFKQKSQSRFGEITVKTGEVRNTKDNSITCFMYITDWREIKNLD